MFTPRGQRLLPRINSVDSDVGGPADTLACRLAQLLPLSLGCLKSLALSQSQTLLLCSCFSPISVWWHLAGGATRIDLAQDEQSKARDKLRDSHGLP